VNEPRDQLGTSRRRRECASERGAGQRRERRDRRCERLCTRGVEPLDRGDRVDVARLECLGEQGPRQLRAGARDDREGAGARRRNGECLAQPSIQHIVEDCTGTGAQ
jgi:hypothetical protein